MKCSFVAIILAAVGLTGCIGGEEKAAKTCDMYQYEEVCSKKPECVWDGACKPAA